MPLRAESQGISDERGLERLTLGLLAFGVSGDSPKLSWRTCELRRRVLVGVETNATESGVGVDDFCTSILAASCSDTEPLGAMVSHNPRAMLHKSKRGCVSLLLCSLAGDDCGFEEHGTG